MDEESSKKFKITWWHLLILSAGLEIFHIHSSPSFLEIILADFLSVFGIGWGILLLTRYLFKKYGKNKFFKTVIVVGIGISLSVILIIFFFLLRFIGNLELIKEDNTILYKNCLDDAYKVYKDYKSFNLNDYCSKNKITENCVLPPDQEHFINGLFDLAKEDCIKNYPQKQFVFE